MEKLSYQVIRSARRSVAIQITPRGQVLVRCPNYMSAAQVADFVESKRHWIEKHLLNLPGEVPALSEQALAQLRKEAKNVFSQRVARFAPLVGVQWNKITLRFQRTRWGSCSAKGNLNFNCLLLLAPPEVLDYVVVHELCHRKEMNHSARFWAEVARVFPDYRMCRKWLREHGPALLARLHNT